LENHVGQVLRNPDIQGLVKAAMGSNVDATRESGDYAKERMEKVISG